MANQPQKQNFVNGETLCRMLGITHVTLRSWEGFSDFPAFEKGSRGVSSRYDSVKVLRWWSARIGPARESSADVELTEAERRKAVAEAELKELQLAQKRGELVNAEEMQAAIAKAFSNVKTRVLGVASTLAPRLAVTTEANVCQALTYDALASALSDLAGNVITDGTDDDPEPSERDATPAPEADRQPVGRKRKSPKPRGKQRAGRVAKR